MWLSTVKEVERASWSYKVVFLSRSGMLEPVSENYMLWSERLKGPYSEERRRSIALSAWSIDIQYSIHTALGLGRLRGPIDPMYRRSLCVQEWQTKRSAERIHMSTRVDAAMEILETRLHSTVRPNILG